MAESGSLDLSAEAGGASRLAPKGRWLIGDVGRLDSTLAGLQVPRDRPLTIDLGGVEALDTAGVWLIYRTAKRLKSEGVTVEFAGIRREHAILLEQVAAADRPAEIEPPHGPAFRRMVERVGAGTLFVLAQMRAFVGFLGLVVEVAAKSVVQPRRLRFTPLVYHMEQVGLNALPIVGLISFLIGVVLAYQGASQLQRFGAEIFVVNLIGVSVLREIGILLTAIVVAGRSGSAFTAQIGSMKIREEVDAMRTLGLDPIEVLVLPRMLALILTLPLLAFFSDMMGLLGGGLMAWFTLGIPPDLFLERLNEAVGLWHFWVGLIKAPVFAALIALVGCYEGMRVEGSAESVGQLTTRSVVESIFLVIVADALFSIFFNIVGV